MNKMIAVNIVLVWNIAVFFLYGIDKRKAAKQKWRISEATLILTALLAGGAGAAMGMVIFNHKTSKVKFRIFVPFALILTIAAGCIAIAW